MKNKTLKDSFLSKMEENKNQQLLLQILYYFENACKLFILKQFIKHTTICLFPISHCIIFMEMIFDDNSSNSEESLGNMDGLFKKVNYDVKIEDSDELSSQQEHQTKEKRKNYSKRISSLLKLQQSQLNKTKTIKKNCVSAKMSRQRKKMYIELLEKRAVELKQQITIRKQSIQKSRNSIMQLLKQTNPEKYQYIEENIHDSKKLVNELMTTQDPNPENRSVDNEKLNYMINSYLYKFGFNGVLRNDVIQCLKIKWYQLALDEKILLAGKEDQLTKILKRFQQCFTNISKKNQRLQYLFRQLRKKLSPQDVVKMIIRKEFFNIPQPITPKKLSIDLNEIEESS